jgi:hypothetical protein
MGGFRPSEDHLQVSTIIGTLPGVVGCGEVENGCFKESSRRIGETTGRENKVGGFSDKTLLKSRIPYWPSIG